MRSRWRWRRPIEDSARRSGHGQPARSNAFSLHAAVRRDAESGQGAGCVRNFVRPVNAIRSSGSARSSSQQEASLVRAHRLLGGGQWLRCPHPSDQVPEPAPAQSGKELLNFLSSVLLHARLGPEPPHPRRHRRAALVAGRWAAPHNGAATIAAVQPHGLDLCTGVRPTERLDARKLGTLMAAVHARHGLPIIDATEAFKGAS